MPASTLQAFADTPFRVRSIGDGNPLLQVTCAGRTDEIDDAALAALESIREHVTDLDLARTRVSDEGCAVIATMPRLTRLDLRQTRVGNQGVKSLAACKELRRLNLFATETGDYALQALAELEKLEHLYVWQTEVSAKAVVKLREGRPNLRVVLVPSLPEPSEAGGDQRRRRR